jgi:hypothetical protein
MSVKLNIRIGFFSLLVCLAFMAGCSAKTQPQFEDDLFSFTYPTSWQRMSELWPNYQSGRDYYNLGVQEVVMVTSVQKQGAFGTYFAVAAAPLVDGQKLAAVYNQAYDPIRDEITQVQEDTVTIGGETGNLIRYQRPWGEPWWEFRDIWIEKEDYVIVLSFHAAPGTLENYEEAYKLILDSFKFEGE